MFSRSKTTNKGIFSNAFKRDETVAEQLSRFDNFEDSEDLSFEDLDGNISFPPNRVSNFGNRVNITTIGTVLSVLAVAAAGVGIAAAVKKSKAKVRSKRELVNDILNKKSLQELQELVKEPKGKSKEELVNEIKNKLTK